MRELRQGTAVVVSFGPCVGKSDASLFLSGLAAGMDNGTTGIMIAKNGSALAVRHGTPTPTVYDKRGQYLMALDATDVGSMGVLRVEYDDGGSTMLPVSEDFMVLSQQEWDRKYAAVGFLDLEVEGTETLAESIRIMRAVLAGEATVISGTVVYKSADSSKPRVTAITDVSGQRPSVTVDGS